MPGIEYLLEALTPINILLALGGVIAGTVIGSLPGLTATMAVAVLVPVTFTMPPASALILMGAIYTGAIYGGAYAAILLNTPGTPSAIARSFRASAKYRPGIACASRPARSPPGPIGSFRWAAAAMGCRRTTAANSY